MDHNYCREMTKRSLQRELDKILKYYMAVYDEYYSTGSRDSALLKDLVDGIQGISAVLEVLEKLKFTDSYIKATIRYFEDKGEKE